MKNTKRFFAMAAALTLAACAAAPMTMNVSAAATENTVSFTGEVKDGVTHNYSAYKIFSGTVDGDNLTNISFAKANAAMEDESVLNSSTKTVTIKLFLMPLSRFAADQMSR